MNLYYIDGAKVRELIDIPGAVNALRNALVSNAVDPEDDGPRIFSPAPNGEFLLMPSSGEEFCGVKSLTLAPQNPVQDKPRVQGVYTLFRNDDLAPVALIDAIELTLIRTPAATLLAAQEILRARAQDGPIGRAVIIGTGPQAAQHARGLHAMFHPEQIRIIGRTAESSTTLADLLVAEGLPAQAGRSQDLPEADIVICVTSSKDPVFEDLDISENAVVLAVGTHGLDAREVPAAFTRRAHVIVEGRGSAMREGGNLIPARNAAEWEQKCLSNLQDLARDHATIPVGQPVLYSGVGMAWEDLVVAADIHRRAQLLHK